MGEPRVIKKYANRRLYDTEASRHITLEGIRQLIIDGHDVRIIDDTSGEDLTRNLLLQIVAEQEQAGKPVLDAQLLTGIIRIYGGPMQNLMAEYLLKSFQTFTTQQNQFQEQMRAAMTATPMAAMQELAANNMKAWQTMQEALLGAKPGNKDDTE